MIVRPPTDPDIRIISPGPRTIPPARFLTDLDIRTTRLVPPTIPPALRFPIARGILITDLDPPMIPRPLPIRFPTDPGIRISVLDRLTILLLLDAQARAADQRSPWL